MSPFFFALRPKRSASFGAASTHRRLGRPWRSSLHEQTVQLCIHSFDDLAKGLLFFMEAIRVHIND